MPEAHAVCGSFDDLSDVDVLVEGGVLFLEPRDLFDKVVDLCDGRVLVGPEGVVGPSNLFCLEPQVRAQTLNVEAADLGEELVVGIEGDAHKLVGVLGRRLRRLCRCPGLLLRIGLLVSFIIHTDNPSLNFEHPIADAKYLISEAFIGQWGHHGGHKVCFPVNEKQAGNGSAQRVLQPPLPVLHTDGTNLGGDELGERPNTLDVGDHTKEFLHLKN
mmetsp:Transcript_7038/g.20348  ORF Transcript_7038/g.20348 Transcript_7038/m.20348 type:complete len:216 (-) Transcript_7038:571-1218(-)